VDALRMPADGAKAPREGHKPPALDPQKNAQVKYLKNKALRLLEIS